jgi:hypothetical protein
MRLVTDPVEAKRLERHLSELAQLHDLVLDDGTFIQDVAVFGNCATGVILGGQSGYVSFSEVPEISHRNVRAAIPLAGLRAWPLIGTTIRRRWAARAGSQLARPKWLPVL